MTSDGADLPPSGSGPARPPVRSRLGAVAGRLTWRELGVVGGALVYAALAALPWASVTFDVLGRVSARGYGLSVLVPVSVVLLVAAAVWTALPASARPAVWFPHGVVTLALTALAFLLTLVVWLRSTDYGFEPVPLLAVLVTAAAGVCAALSLLPELRGTSWRAPGRSTAR